MKMICQTVTLNGFDGFDYVSGFFENSNQTFVREVPNVCKLPVESPIRGNLVEPEQRIAQARHLNDHSSAVDEKTSSRSQEPNGILQVLQDMEEQHSIEAFDGERRQCAAYVEAFAQQTVSKLFTWFYTCYLQPRFVVGELQESASPTPYLEQSAIG